MGQSFSAHLRRVCTLGFLAIPFGTMGQAQETRGLRMTFGIEQGLLWRDNPNLNLPSTGTDTSSRTQLRFAFVSETRSQRLALDLKGAVAAASKTEDGLVSPAATLSYQRENAAAMLRVDASFRENDVDTLNFATEDPLVGSPVVTSVRGIGTRAQTTTTAMLALGRNAPFGGNFSIGRTDTIYKGTSDPSLIDNILHSATVSARFDLTKTSKATVGLTKARLEEDGKPTKDSETLMLDFEQQGVNGTYIASFAATQLEDGSRQAMRLGRSFDLPAGQLSFVVGASTAINGTAEAIGKLDWQQELATGVIRLGLLREFRGSDRADETRVARLNLNYEQELTPLLGLTLAFGLQDSRDTMTGRNIVATDLSASLKRDLTTEWGLNLGATHRIKDDDRLGRVDSSGVFITLSRDFEFRP